MGQLNPDQETGDHRVRLVRRSTGGDRGHYVVQLRADDPDPDAVRQALTRLAGLGVVHVTRDIRGRAVFVLAAPVARNRAVLHHVLDQLPAPRTAPAAASVDEGQASLEPQGFAWLPELPSEDALRPWT